MGKKDLGNILDSIKTMDKNNSINSKIFFYISFITFLISAMIGYYSLLISSNDLHSPENLKIFFLTSFCIIMFPYFLLLSLLIMFLFSTLMYVIVISLLWFFRVTWPMKKFTNWFKVGLKEEYLDKIQNKIRGKSILLHAMQIHTFLSNLIFILFIFSPFIH